MGADFRGRAILPPKARELPPTFARLRAQIEGSLRLSSSFRRELSLN
jgi:hypothetical protein